MALVHTYFFSNTLGMNVECEVVLPQISYRKEEFKQETKIPVLWLLHGGSDDQTMWQRRTSIERYAANYGLAVVMPFAEFSGYRDQVHGSGAYYTYMTKELPMIMHDFFGFSLDREDNYVAGMSMGGNGSLKFGMANPDKYSVIGCLSAGFFDHDVPKDAKNLDKEKDYNMWVRYDGREIAGSEEDMLENARKIIREGKPAPRVFHSIGDDDHCMRHAVRTREFFESFEGNPFGYVYEQHPGRHNWEYWDVHIQRFLEFVKEYRTSIGR